MVPFDTNMKSLLEKFPHTADEVRRFSISEPGLSLNTVWQEGVDRDEQWLTAVDQSIGDCKIIFLYGFGRGFSLIDLLERYPDRWFFVYEPDVASFIQAFQEMDLSLLIEHPNFYWLSLGEKQLKQVFHVLASYMQEEMVFVALRKYLEQDMASLREVKETFEEYRHSFFMNKRTENRFRLEWTRNYLYHAADIFSSCSFEQLLNKLEGITAVIVSSGPSLQEDIEWIKKIRERALIVAAGSSIQALVKNGIKPHLCVIMDGHPVNKNIFDLPEASESPLLYTSSSYYEISDNKLGTKIISVMKSDFITQYLFQAEQDQFFIHPTATVAGTAIQAAVGLGAERIILAGQDLSFPNQKLYADGIEHLPSEDVKSLIEGALQKVANVKGGHNSTDGSFMLMKEGLEGLIAALPQIEFVNSTRHGADIIGAPFKPIDVLYKELEAEKIECSVIENLVSTERMEPNEEYVHFIQNKLELILEDSKDMLNEIAGLLKKIKQLRELSRTKPAKAQRIVESIQKEWGAVADREWFAPMMETLMPIQLAAFDRMLPSIVTEGNSIKKSDLIHKHLGDLLKQIEEQLPELQSILQESIQRIVKLGQVD